MKRRFWQSKILEALDNRSIAWLAGVRRAGKTTLARALPGAHYYDCELIRVRRRLEEPELFWRDHSNGDLVVLDEVHRLQNPSEVLKIAADHFPKVRVVATGSSTLAAKQKFRDTLTGRKREVWLVPMVASDMEEAGTLDLDRRMLQGGLPPFFLTPSLDDKDFEEWIDSYWSKDLSELFVIDKKSSFMKFVELLFAQSGGLFEAQSFSAPCEVSRPTIQNYLSILETTLLATVIRPYHGGSATEIRSQPKVYAFDTGFVSYFRGWDSLRDDDRGQLLEHLVMGEILARFGPGKLHYWRDKHGHEVDFILEIGRRKQLLVIECKSSGSKLDSSSIEAFRRRYPTGENIVVTLRDADTYSRRLGEVEGRIVPYFKLPSLLDSLKG